MILAIAPLAIALLSGCATSVENPLEAAKIYPLVAERQVSVPIETATQRIEAGASLCWTGQYLGGITVPKLFPMPTEGAVRQYAVMQLDTRAIVTMMPSGEGTQYRIQESGRGFRTGVYNPEQIHNWVAGRYLFDCELSIRTPQENQFLKELREMKR